MKPRFVWERQVQHDKMKYMKLTAFGKSTGLILILIACGMWALDGVLRRYLTVDLPPITIVWLEHLTGFLIILPFFLLAWPKKPISKQAWGLALIVAALASLGGTLFFTTALAKTAFVSFSVVFLLQKLQPIFAISLSAVILKEKISSHFLWWSGLALIAAYFMTFPNGVVNWATGSATILAGDLAILAAICWGSATPFSKLLLNQVPVTVATGMRFGLTTLLALPLIFLLNGSISINSITTTNWAMLILIALSTGMGALWIYYQGLSRNKAHVAAILEMTWPVMAVLIDVVLFQTVLLPSQYLTAVIMFGAVWQATKATEINSEATSKKIGGKVSR